MKKKIIALTLSLSFALSLTPTFGAEVESDILKNAIVTAKSKLNIGEEYSEFNYSGEPTNNYYLDWETKDGDSINVAINSKGKIIQYSKYTNTKNKIFYDFSKSDIQQKADLFLKKMLDNEYKNYKLEKSYYNSSESRFVYREYRNGIAITNNVVEIRVLNVNCDVIGFYWNTYQDNYGDLKIDDSKNITVDEAKKSYIDNNGIELVYNYNNDWKNNKVNVYPQYQINSQKVIDAKTGKAIDLSNEIFYASNTQKNSMSVNAEATDASGISLSENEIKTLEETKNLMSSEDVVKNLKKYNLVDNDFKITNSCLTKKNIKSSEYFWDITGSTDNNNEYIITADAVTGELICFNDESRYYDDYEEIDNKTEYLKTALTETDAKAKADKYLRTFAANNSAELNYSAETYYRDYFDEYQFNYTRTINNKKFYKNSITVCINKSTGKLSYYNKNWDNNLEISDIAIKLDSTTAFEKFAQSGDFDFAYQVIGDENNQRLAIVYGAVNSIDYYINPATGNKVTYLNEPYKEENNSIGYTDISGHKDEEKIQKLYDIGIKFDRNEFKPDDVMTQKDLLEFLSSRLDPNNKYIPESSTDSTDAKVKTIFTDNGIDYNPDKALTKYDIAKIIAFSLITPNNPISFKGLLDDDDIFISPFEDVKSDMVAEVSILVKEKIMSGENGKFNGDDEVTNSDVAVVIYNTLKLLENNISE